MLIHKNLQTSIKGSGKRSPLAQARLENISWVKSLNRSGLSYQDKEVMLDLHVTPAGETISIKYPGKESRAGRKNVYEYDFRPKVRLNDGSYADDLTFFQIWEALYQKMPTSPEGRALLGVIFYRMAYMVDYVKFPPVALNTLSEPDLGALPLTGYLGLDFQSLKPALGVWAEGNDWAGMSLEAFLRYNDLLALNEDTKYWYRSVKLKNEDWGADGVGRVNTMLTHLSVIGFHSNKIRFASMIGRFSRNGVCAANKGEAISICSPYLV